VIQTVELLGNYLFSDFRGLYQTPPVLSFLNSGDVGCLAATCLDVCILAENQLHPQLLLRESDLDIAAYYRLWGHRY